MPAILHCLQKKLLTRTSRGGQRDLSRPFYSHWLEYDQHCHMPSLHTLKGSLIAVTVWMILWHQNHHQTSHSETLVALSAQYLQSCFHICGQRGAWGSQSQLLHRLQKMPWKYNSTQQWFMEHLKDIRCDHRKLLRELFDLEHLCVKESSFIDSSAIEQVIFLIVLQLGVFCCNM